MQSGVEQGQLRRESSSGVPILEAYLVTEHEHDTDGPIFYATTQEIYTVEAETILPCYKQTLTRVLISLICILLIIFLIA